MELNSFTSKSIEAKIMQKYPNINGIRIIKTTKNKQIKGIIYFKYQLIFEFLIENQPLHAIILVDSLDNIHNDWDTNNKITSQFHSNIQVIINNNISIKFILDQFFCKYLYLTGNELRTPSPFDNNKINTLIEDKSLTVEQILLEINSTLWVDDIFMNGTEEALSYLNNEKVDFIQKQQCERCQTTKILREFEHDCCDICQHCYEEITFARKNVLKRTHDAVGYLRGTQNNDPKLEMSAFLHIFHPELSKEKMNMLIKEAK